MALIIYLQILLLLFLPQLQKFYFYFDKSVQLQMAIYFQFYHNLINLKHTLLLLILLFILRFKNFFRIFFPTSCHAPYIIKICTGLINSTSPQKAMKFLSGLTISTSTMQLRTKPTHMPSSLQDVPPTFVIIDTDCPPPTCTITTHQPNFSSSMQIQQTNPYSSMYMYI